MAVNSNSDGGNRDDIEIGTKKNSTGRQHTHSARQQRHNMELDMIQDFDRVLVSRLSSIRAIDMGESEKSLALKLLRSLGILEGLAAATFAFYGLNRFPRHFARHIQKKERRSQSYVLDKSNPAPKKLNSPFQLRWPRLLQGRPTEV